MDFCFSFPAIKGIQAGKFFYSVMCPLEILSKLFDFYNNEIPEEFRAQRVLNEKRVPEIKNYILTNASSYVFSSITASIDGDYNFIPSDFNADIGILQISMNSNLLINDGQHRKAAIDEALKEKPELKNEAISVVLFVDHGLVQSQQMFSDLNKHAVNVSNSLSILYNHRDPFAKFTKDILDGEPRAMALIEKSNSSIGKKSKKIFTLSSFYMANELLLPNFKTDFNEEIATRATQYWHTLFSYFNEWRMIIQNEVSAYSSRQTSIATYGIVLEAIGQLGHEIISNKSLKLLDLIKKMNHIDWSRTNPQWINRCIQSDGSVKKSTINRKLTANLIKQLIGLELTPTETEIESNFRKENDHGN